MGLATATPSAGDERGDFRASKRVVVQIDPGLNMAVTREARMERVSFEVMLDRVLEIGLVRLSEQRDFQWCFAGGG